MAQDKLLTADDPWGVIASARKLEIKATLCLDIVRMLLPGIPDVQTEGIAASLMKLDVSELKNIEAMYDKCVACG